MSDASDTSLMGARGAIRFARSPLAWIWMTPLLLIIGVGFALLTSTLTGLWDLRVYFAWIGFYLGFGWGALGMGVLGRPINHGSGMTQFLRGLFIFPMGVSGAVGGVRLAMLLTGQGST